jgi:glycosyltransferase involved in cell wall biosynthesis
MLGDHQGCANPPSGRRALMKIAYLCADRGIPVLGDKGASVHVREFVSALAGLGHEVTLLCAKQGTGNPCPPVRLIELPPDESPDEMTREAAQLGMGNEERDLTLQRELGKLACDRKLAARVLTALDQAGVQPDLLYERYALFHRAGGQVATALNIPLMLEVNAPLAEEQERFRGLCLKAMADATETETLCRSDHIIAVSAAVREHALSRGASVERVTVLPNGVDTSRFHPEVDGRPVRERYELDGRPVIGFIGSLKPWHGLDFLLDAFTDILAHRPDAALLLVGEGPALADLQARVARDQLHGRVILTGRVPHADIPAYLAAMDVTVAPYTAQDGFYFSPLKVVESLAAGRPVVAPRLGQLTDLLQDGVTDTAGPSRHLAAFVERVLELLNDAPRLLAMGRAAAAAAREDFGWDKTARRATQIMMRLQAAGGRR